MQYGIFGVNVVKKNGFGVKEQWQTER